MEVSDELQSILLIKEVEIHHVCVQIYNLKLSSSHVFRG